MLPELPVKYPKLVVELFISRPLRVLKKRKKKQDCIIGLLLASREPQRKHKKEPGMVTYLYPHAHVLVAPPKQLGRQRHWVAQQAPRRAALRVRNAQRAVAL